MAKRLTDKQKEEMIESFKDGKPIEIISQYLKCTKLTISRNLKKILGDKIYNDLIQIRIYDNQNQCFIINYL